MQPYFERDGLVLFLGADHLAGRMLMRALNKPLSVVSTPLTYRSSDWIGVLDSESVHVRPTEDGFLREWRSG